MTEEKDQHDVAFQMDFEVATPPETKTEDNDLGEEVIEVEKKKTGKPIKKVETPEKVEAPIEVQNTEEEDEAETNDSLITALAKNFDYELAENEQYEETEEGLINFVNNLSTRVADDKLDSWFSGVHPKAVELFDLVHTISDLPREEQDAKLDSFFKGKVPEIDYTQIDLTNEDTQKAVVRSMLRKMDYTDEEIRESIEESEIAGTLEKQATRAAGKLADIQKKEKVSMLAEEKAAKSERDEQMKGYWIGVRDAIQKGEVNGFQIPLTERKGVFDYMYSGQLSQDVGEMTTEQRIQLAIAIKNKFDLSKYITQKAKTVVANNLRDKLKGATTKLKGAEDRSSTGGGGISFNLQDYDNSLKK